jgi:hypothetical protein
MPTSLQDTLVGGGLVLLGVLTSQLISLYTDRKAREERRNVLLRQKYEELTNHILDSMSELHSYLKCQSIQEAVSSRPTVASSKAAYLALIYFHDLYQPAIQYHNALSEFHRFLSMCYRNNPVGSLEASACQDPDY